MNLERQPRREDSEEHIPLDEFARRGHFKKGDLPGTDTYDDGINEKGELRPGSTTVESGGTYMEDKGPIDLRHKGQQDNAARQSDLRIQEGIDSVPDEQAGDAADKWLRENDPNWGKQGAE